MVQRRGSRESEDLQGGVTEKTHQMEVLPSEAAASLRLSHFRHPSPHCEPILSCPAGKACWREAFRSWLAGKGTPDRDTAPDIS